LRLHEGRATPWPRYGRAALRTWVGRIAGTFDEHQPAYVYFNNDPGGAAVVDAATLAEIARRRGLAVTRAPGHAKG
jgi:uncharacterized protein YecE (DUF72 family)